jgi:hypothetical protein
MTKQLISNQFSVGYHYPEVETNNDEAMALSPLPFYVSLTCFVLKSRALLIYVLKALPPY